jgi:cysteine desulfurase
MNMRFSHQLRPSISPLQRKAVKEAIEILYGVAGARPNDHFIFTSSGAEGVNHATWATYLDITRKTGKNQFLCSSLDEAPAIMAMSRLTEVGCVFQMIPVSGEGKVSAKSLVEKLNPRTAMVSLSWAHGLTGVIQPLNEIAELCCERGILLHVEASHVLGKGDFTFKESGAHIMTFNGFPQGTGGLFIRENSEISPLILGGTEQRGMRGGSFSVQGLIELASWAQREYQAKDHYGIEVARLRALFEELVTNGLPTATSLFKNQPRVPHITSFLFESAASDALCYLLSRKGVDVTFGGNSFQHFAHVLKACGIPEPLCHCGLSFGFSSDTSEKEIVEGAQIVVESVCQLQKYGEGVFYDR